MDDGGKLDYNKNTKNKGLVLNTHSFTKEEVEKMGVELKDKFQLNTSIRLNKNKIETPDEVPNIAFNEYSHAILACSILLS